VLRFLKKELVSVRDVDGDVLMCSGNRIMSVVSFLCSCVDARVAAVFARRIICDYEGCGGVENNCGGVENSCGGVENSCDGEGSGKEDLKEGPKEDDKGSLDESLKEGLNESPNESPKEGLKESVKEKP
ncbi:hypothetical protein THOM_0137, partial [Trachipleistophora hominis]